MNNINLYPKIILLKTLSEILLFCETVGREEVFSFSELLFLLSAFFSFVPFPRLSPSDKLPNDSKEPFKFLIKLFKN